MNSFFSKYYLDLQKRINKVQDIAWIEQDFGQDSNDKWRANVAFPAVLIDFASADYENIASGGGTATVTVSIRLLVSTFSQSYELAPDAVKEKALEYFELEQRLIDVLHGWQPRRGYTQPLMLTRTTSSNKNNLGIRIREMQFTTAFQEYEDNKNNNVKIVIIN